MLKAVKSLSITELKIPAPAVRVIWQFQWRQENICILWMQMISWGGWQIHLTTHNYTYIANTISMFAEPAKPQKVDRHSNRLKPVNRNEMVAGVYKDDDEKYSLQNLLKRQEEGDL